MKVEIKFTGPIRRPWPEPSRILELEEGISIVELLSLLGFEEEEGRFVTVLLDGQALRHYRKVPEGATLILMVPAGGG